MMNEYAGTVMLDWERKNNLIKIVIWGTGIRARQLCRYLNFSKVEIICLTDNSGDENKELWDGYKYIPPNKAVKLKFDYIVIASMAFCEITAQLMHDWDIDREFIIQANNVQFMIPDTLYFFSQIETEQKKYSIFTDINSFSCEIV